MTFGEILRDVCREKGISLKEFSDLTGIPYQTIKNYATDRRRPNGHQLQKIADTKELAEFRTRLILGPVVGAGFDTVSNELTAKTVNDDELNDLLKRVRELDLLDDAVDYLKYLIVREEKK